MTIKGEVEIQPDGSMIRPCDWYWTEFYECKRIKGRFHQYFIHGKYHDCSQWARDYKNCELWKKKKNEKAYKQLLESEKIRKFQRLQPHYQNDVWKKREKPPENWNAPLPDWIVEKNKDTYLDKKAKAIANGTVDDSDMKFYNKCLIL